MFFFKVKYAFIYSESNLSIYFPLTLINSLISTNIFAGLPKELNRTREAIAGSEDNKVSTCCLPFIILNILVRALFALKSSSKIHFSTGDGRLG